MAKTLANLPHLNQNYSSYFDGVYPYSEIGRWIVDKDNASLKYKLDKKDSAKKLDGTPSVLTGEDGDVMVKVPAFYYKTVFNMVSGKTAYELTNVVPNATGSNCPIGFKIHPAFVRVDGAIAPYFLTGAFKGFLINGQLRSVANAIPTSNRNIGQFRTDARNGRSINYGIENFYQISALQMLFLVEFQSTDSQKVLGRGKADLVWDDAKPQCKTGDTIGLGDRSGYLMTLGLGNGKESISYRGIEDFYGSIWSLVDGLLIKDDGYYHTNNPSAFGIEANHTKTACNVLTHATTDGSLVEGYIKKMEQLSDLDFALLPKEVGGTDSKYYCDYFWSHRKTATNIAHFGGRLSGASPVGLACWYLSIVASSAYLDIAGRLSFLKNN
ncbi:MAG: hypothetical protein ACRCZ0_00750 [Cetobacterium sp.]